LVLDRRSVTLVESQDSLIELSDDEASALEAVGRSLASKRDWWGSAGDDKQASVVACRPAAPGRWHVRVSDAVGIIALPSLQLTIEPKIPTPHLLFLLEASGQFPRLAPQRAVAMRDMFLWELILHWYITEVELVLRRGLLRDYQETRDVLSVVRGSIDAVSTGQMYYRGQLAFECTFDEFDFDTPPNRLLAEACRVVLGTPTSQALLRRRAKRAVARFEDVRDMRQDDLRWRPERRAGYYGTAATLARHIIQGFGRTLAYGKEPVTTFLIRTPEMIEAGLRSLLQTALPEHEIEKRGLRLVGSTMTLNPDLVFDGGKAVGDVKYKLLDSDWPRNDLYQLVAFATGYRSRRGLLVHFAPHRDAQLPSVRVGDVSLYAASWNAQPEIGAREALDNLIAAVGEFLNAAELNSNLANDLLTAESD
jgi:5-methylcytosine-specific restriction enzyme subunit McrC